jgi:hypothetical protein
LRKVGSFKGDGAKRSGLGLTERWRRRFVGRGGTIGVEVDADADAFSWALDGLGGMTGGLAVDADMVGRKLGVGPT